MKRVAFFVLCAALGVGEVYAQPSNSGGGLIITRASSATITSGSTVVSGGADKSVCFTDSTVINCANTGIQYDKATTTLTVTTIAPGFNLGNADTTITRSAAGKVAVEGVDLVDISAAQTLTNKTLSSTTITGTTSVTTGSVIFSSNVNIAFGSNAVTDWQIYKNTVTTPDTLTAFLGSISNSIIFIETADGGFDQNNGPCGTSACTDPTVIVYSHLQDTTHWVALYDNGTNGVLDTGSGGISVPDGFASYKSVNTTGWGVPAIYATGRSTAQTAAVATVATYTVGAADGSFLVSANVLVTTSTTHSFSVQVDYTDESNVARTLTLPMAQLAGTFAVAITNVTGAGPYEGSPLRIRCKASTAITIKTAGTFTTVTYNVEGDIVQVS